MKILKWFSFFTFLAEGKTLNLAEFQSHGKLTARNKLKKNNFRPDEER